MKISKFWLSISLWFAAAVFSFGETKIRVGHFPNITHAQGLVAHGLSRQGKGWFEQRLGPGTKIEWFIYNAGPSAMEAIFAKSIDLTYVGSGPALNAYTKSNGEEIRLIAGAANGGAGLAVQPGQNFKTPADFRGKKIATPQLGNTQDISCRAWLREGGLKITQLGGDALQTKESGCGLDGRAVALATGTRSLGQSNRRGKRCTHHSIGLER
ncbi:MAG: hypothetical protein DME50_06875 [Verrucomicrobia bacterium]|nr:MAG: hypothetical protein DME50_06875 [Verrucomicrobiota bacterium]